MSSLNVSIIIVSYNSSRFLPALFESLRKTKYPSFEVIAVDNASQDDSAVIIQSWKDKIPLQFIQSSSNLGFSGGMNLGIMQAKGKYIVLLNPDTVVLPNWLDKLLSHAAASNVGIVGGVNILMDAQNKIDFERIKHIHPKPLKAHMVSGSLFLFKRELLDKLGPLDHDYFLYWEDTAYCFGAYLLGYDVIWANDVYYFHYSGGSTGIRSQRNRNEFQKNTQNKKLNVAYYYYRNELLFYLTSFQWRNVITRVPRPFLRATYHLIVKHNPGILLALFSGIAWLVHNRKLVWEKRKRVQSLRTRSDAEFFKRMREKDAVATALLRYYSSIKKSNSE